MGFEETPFRQIYQCEIKSGTNTASGNSLVSRHGQPSQLCVISLQPGMIHNQSVAFYYLNMSNSRNNLKEQE